MSTARPANLAKRRSLLGALLVASSTIFPPAFAQTELRLEITGSLVTPRRLSLADLAALPQTEISESRSLAAGQSLENARVTWRGVLLRDVLKAVKFEEKERHDFRRSFFVARATDGYVALFSWGEVFNSKLGDNILIVTSADGKPLPASEGPYALRSLGDLRPGPRHVKWLQRIEVSTRP